MNRRAFFSVLAALPVIAIRPAAAGVETAAPLRGESGQAFAIPRGAVVRCTLVDWRTVADATHTHTFTTPATMNVRMISTGRGLVPLESEEGQAIAREMHRPSNLRSDGSIRHRQHHPVDFPPRR